MALTGSKSTILAANCLTLTQFGTPRLPEESKMNTRSNGDCIEHTGTVASVDVGPAVVVRVLVLVLVEVEVDVEVVVVVEVDVDVPVELLVWVDVEVVVVLVEVDGEVIVVGTGVVLVTIGATVVVRHVDDARIVLSWLLNNDEKSTVNTCVEIGSLAITFNSATLMSLPTPTANTSTFATPFMALAAFTRTVDVSCVFPSVTRITTVFTPSRCPRLVSASNCVRARSRAAPVAVPAA